MHKTINVDLWLKEPIFANELSNIKIDYNSFKVSNDLLTNELNEMKKTHQRDLYLLQMKNFSKINIILLYLL
jgi:hypothetical protein